VSCQSPDEGDGCGDGDESLGNGGELLVVAHEPAAFHDPGEGALNDPAAADHGEALRARRALDDFQSEVGLGLRPGDEATGVSAVGIDVLDEREAGARTAQDALGAVTILDVSGVNLDSEEASVGVGQDVPLPAVDLLAGVEPFESPF
jgi:hypothetical protein